jgi:dienelactone hydrolase
MPNTASAEEPVPAVILVHGSGSHNKDLSLFDNRVFWDIAEYLSSNGIAVIRYNQRSWTHPERFNEQWQFMTVWDEAIYDAVYAAEILRADERISEVFVVGLSLGGMLAPQIAEAANLDGAVLMAGSPRSLYEVQLDQNIQAITDMLEAGIITAEDADTLFRMVDESAEEARNFHGLPMEEIARATIFGLPAIYQMSIVNALPLPLISASNRPILIMQGGRDFQVFADVDFQIFLDYTENMAHVTAILYENLNHLFMVAQTDYNDIREYLPIGNVYRRALNDVVEWIFDNLGGN